MQTPPYQRPDNLPPEWVAPFLAVVILICIGAWLLMPLIRAWAKRIEARGHDAASSEELIQIRERLAELELSEVRMHELEERLDFAERLLAQRNEPLQMPLHRTPV